MKKIISILSILFIAFNSFGQGHITVKVGGGGGGSGTVTSVAKGYGMLPDGTITTTGTVTVDSATLALTFKRNSDSTDVSMLNGGKIDTSHIPISNIQIIQQGSGQPMLRGSNDTLYSPNINGAGTVTVTKNPDSSVTITGTGSGTSGISKLGTPAYLLTKINDSTYNADTSVTGFSGLYPRRKDSTVAFTTPYQSSLKADNSTVMHLTGNETVADNKIYTGTTYSNLYSGRQFIQDFDAQISYIINRVSSHRANVAFIGDSWTASQGFSNPVQVFLQSNYGDAGVGFIGINSSQLAPMNVTVTTAGTWTDLTLVNGLSLSAANTTTTSSTKTIVIGDYCSDAIIHYTMQPGGGAFTYAYDGNSPISVNTDSTGTGLGLVRITGMTTALTHTITITCTVAGTSGVTIQGIDAFNTRISGVSVSTLGMYGAKTQDWLNMDSTFFSKSLQSFKPNLIFLCLGVNDNINSVPIGTYSSNLDKIIKRIYASMPLCNIVLLSQTDISSTTPMIGYVNQMAQVASSDSCGFINNFKLLGSKVNADSRGITGGTIHLNTYGYNLIANNIIGFISSALPTRDGYATKLVYSLDSLNAHLAGAEVFNGAKDFNVPVTSGKTSFAGGFQNWKTATTYISLQGTGSKMGIYSSSPADYILYYNTSTGSTNIMSTFANQPIQFLYQNTELARFTSTGQLGVGTIPAASTKFDIASTTQGARITTMTTTQMNAISSPATGLQVTNITIGRICVYDGSGWRYSPNVYTGTAAPTTTPLAVGDRFDDTTNKKAYEAMGTSSSSDWVILN